MIAEPQTSKKYDSASRATVLLSGETYRLVRLIAADEGVSASKVMSDLIEAGAKELAKKVNVK